jgi:hypothetical protein
LAISISDYKKGEFVMTTHQENQQATLRSTLLAPQEQAVCEQIATREAPHGQRALALLALNEKSTQAQAAEQAGLTLGQVRYWLAKFRKQRLDIFPDALFDELDAEAKEAAIELVTEIEEELEPVTEQVDFVEDETEDAKSDERVGKAKRGKKSKKAKKPKKKTKKGKRGKKSKKKKKSKK